MQLAPASGQILVLLEQCQAALRSAPLERLLIHSLGQLPALLRPLLVGLVVMEAGGAVAVAVPLTLQVLAAEMAEMAEAIPENLQGLMVEVAEVAVLIPEAEAAVEMKNQAVLEAAEIALEEERMGVLLLVAQAEMAEMAQVDPAAAEAEAAAAPEVEAEIMEELAELVPIE